VQGNSGVWNGVPVTKIKLECAGNNQDAVHPEKELERCSGAFWLDSNPALKDLNII
jgi:hypothetical protein